MRIETVVYIDIKTGRLSSATMLKPDSEFLDHEYVDIERDARLLNMAHKAIKEAIEKVNDSLDANLAEDPKD